MIPQFQVPPTIVLGAGARCDLPAYVQKFQARRVLVVTDSFWKNADVTQQYEQNFRAAGVVTTIFADVQPDPTVKNVMDGLQQLRQADAEVVVGLGGGSPMDAAKAIAVLATNEPPLSQYAGYHRIPKPGLPLILIPTTAGTGSEATRVAIITDTERDVKMMLLDQHLLARVALVDFELSMSMPRSLTANVGIDTLTHGIEAYVSRRANALTDPIALACVRLVAENLETAFLQPQHRLAREAMMAAACQGGIAFSNSSVALVHGMSRPLGAHFHVPHGQSNAVLLPEVTRFSLPSAVERYAHVARVMRVASEQESDETAGSRLLTHLDVLNKRLDIGRLRDAVRVDRHTFESRLEAMAVAALESGSPQNNPRVPTSAEIIDLYRLAW